MTCSAKRHEFVKDAVSGGACVNMVSTGSWPELVSSCHSLLIFPWTMAPLSGRPTHLYKTLFFVPLSFR